MNKYEEAFHVVSMGDSFPGAEEQFEKGLEVLRGLVEKETPKETIWGEEIDEEWGLHHLGPKCPTCGKFVTRRETFFYGEEYNYCGFCGQRLKWGDENEE